MAQPVVLTLTGVGSTRWSMQNIHITPFNVAIGCIVSGTATYTVEYTYDNPENPNATINVYSHSVLINQTASNDGFFAYPVRAIRVSITSGSGTVTTTILQAGITN